MKMGIVKMKLKVFSCWRILYTLTETQSRRATMQRVNTGRRVVKMGMFTNEKLLSDILFYDIFNILYFDVS